MKVHQLAVGPFVQNVFLAICPETKRGIVIDPGFEPQAILTLVEQEGVEVVAVVATHAHLDHVWGAWEVCQATGAPFMMHPSETDWLERLGSQAALYALPPPEGTPEIDRELGEGDEVTFGNVTLTVIHTPGHSPGSLCLHDGDGTVFAGDTLFQYGVGRTDLPGGDTEQLVRSIRDRLYTLPPETVVHCGHGPSTTVGAEMAGNPFVQG